MKLDLIGDYCVCKFDVINFFVVGIWIFNDVVDLCFGIDSFECVLINEEFYVVGVYIVICLLEIGDV
ncbi:hypothetical protein GUF71_08895, partial [Xanthomonas citri pv. citri]|nr:hypothetical protein [Xanthomonas citri pv. citri]